MRRAASLLLACCACGSSDPPPAATGIAGLVTVSAAAPWPATCGEQPGGRSTFTRNAEVEPAIAIDPLDASHLIGAWQQDRWSNGGARGVVSATTFDGGHTWASSFAAFTLCSGGAYQRATDPWVSIGPDGTAWQIAFAFDGTDANQAMLISRSLDRGRTWETPKALIVDSDPDIGDDKETVTADPHDASFAYAVWDRLTGVSAPNGQGTGPAWFARTTDRGETWQPARAIYDPGADAQTIGNQIVVLPDGTLVNLMSVITQTSTSAAAATMEVIRSSDRGVTWSAQPVSIATQEFVGPVDPKTGTGIRSGSIVPAIAADARSGALYVVWEDARFSSQQRDGIAISRSIDGGLHWSAPEQVNGAPAAQAFTPTVNVAADGSVGVLYTDLRDDDPANRDQLLATQWLAISTDGSAPWTESRVGAPWNLRGAPLVAGPAYFLGDYQGLTHAGNVFLPFFAAVPGAGPSDIFFRTANAPASLAPFAAAAASASTLLRPGRERWRFGRLFK